MKAMAWCVAGMLLAGTACWAAEGASAVSQGKTADAATQNGDREPAPGTTCYMPYAASRDHLVLGCEIPGYRMRYDLAQQLDLFMVLLPDGADTFRQARFYFSEDTLPMDGHSPQAILEADFKNVLAKRPGTHLVKKLTHTLPIRDGGKCTGLSLAYPKKVASFPYETYFICDGGSRHYALLLSLSARSSKAMDAAMPDFIRWADVPQEVRDFRIYDFTGNNKAR
jgi:hypothetical protein